VRIAIASTSRFMKDPRIADMDPKSMPFDGKRTFWGGFKVFSKFEPSRPPVPRAGPRVIHSGYMTLKRVPVIARVAG
jgi:hypothetical protein